MKRKMDVLFRESKIYDIDVWTDVDRDVLRNIEGVTCVHREIGNPHFRMNIDPRYDIDDIKDAIRERACLKGVGIPIRQPPLEFFDFGVSSWLVRTVLPKPVLASFCSDYNILSIKGSGWDFIIYGGNDQLKSAIQKFDREWRTR